MNSMLLQLQGRRNYELYAFMFWIE